MMTIEYSAVKPTTGGTTAGNTAGIRTSGKKLMKETTGEVMFVDRKINGLGTITEKEMVLGNQKIMVNGQSKEC